MHTQKGISEIARSPMVYLQNEDNTVLCAFPYNKKYATKTISAAEFKELKTECTKFAKKSAQYVLFKAETATDKASISAELKQLIDIRDQLMVETETKIDLFKTGDLRRTTIDFFYQHVQHIETDHINYDEAFWLDNATVGALMWAVPYEGEAYELDMISCYPSILSSVNFLVPTKTGTFTTFTQEQFDEMKYLKFGIYHCTITGFADYSRKLFRENTENLYTSWDVVLAKELGLTVTLIINKYPNALLYDGKQRMTGSQVFASTIRELFKLKEKKIPYGKDMIKKLHGYLTQRNERTFYINDEIDEERIIPDYYEEIEEKRGMFLNEKGEHNTIATFVDTRKYFETGFARIKPFLLSKARCIMARLMMNNMDDIVRVHTDGMIVKRKLPNVDVGEKLGDFKYKLYCDHVWIKNMNAFYPPKPNTNRKNLLPDSKWIELE